MRRMPRTTLRILRVHRHGDDPLKSSWAHNRANINAAGRFNPQITLLAYGIYATLPSGRQIDDIWVPNIREAIVLELVGNVRS